LHNELISISRIEKIIIRAEARTSIDEILARSTDHAFGVALSHIKDFFKQITVQYDHGEDTSMKQHQWDPDEIEVRKKINLDSLLRNTTNL